MTDLTGRRFAALIGDGDTTSGITLHTIWGTPLGLEVVAMPLAPGTTHYPSLTPDIPSAFWYERALHDLYGVIPDGHPRLDPLVLPHIDNGTPLPRRVMGTGLFTIPHGPVRSGVFESVEYVVETPGEDIPHVNVRPFAKHRGLEVRFGAMTVHSGVMLAERVEGIASVAHALAFSHAVERLTGAEPPPRAQLARVLHAELERIANHLDVAVKLADAAGLAVAVARFGYHKERVLRLVSALCGNRFGRGVVVPGGIRSQPRLAPGVLQPRLDELRHDIQADAGALMGTASFLDRLRATGPLDPDEAALYGLLGPVGRACGLDLDTRWRHPYDAYPLLKHDSGPQRDAGDAMARLQVRWDELDQSFDLLRQVIELLPDTEDTLRAPVEPVAGIAVAAVEAPQGEVLYLIRADAEGHLSRCAPRSASFHNLAVFSHTFAGDILTDFPFIEASFGVSIAGVVM
ncbi:NADH-quinone oxidoreductase subunit C [Amycolatopsis sp. GM8]|uniref:hydrogenase large subunit n=1 Tax=Amycolatopsis sp. GM8 TaxID=2896530 RepID=UPI001F3E6219|nr:NADH-quinone oxidoreductase subunit C [Amycolatopsis sp. GM8]